MAEARAVGDKEARYNFWEFAGKTDVPPAIYEQNKDFKHTKINHGAGKWFNVASCCFVLMILMFNPHLQPGRIMAGDDWRKHNHNGW